MYGQHAPCRVCQITMITAHVTALLGWLSIESHIDIKRLSWLCYVHRLICAEPRSIARKLTVHVFMQMYIDKDISTYEGPISVLY